MDQPRYRLLSPPEGPSLDQDQLQSLSSQFEIVSGERARDAAKSPKSTDILLHPISRAATPLEIEAQGLIAFPTTSIESMNSVQRLKWFEERLTAILRDGLNFQHFEVRLLNPRTEQLELVVAVGIKPLGVGKSLYARMEGQGISGYVAVTGRTYHCRSVQDDPRYTTGIENARSTLTVPLLLAGKSMGVLNIETEGNDPFTPERIAEVEMLATHIAIALHMFNLLVVERYTTRKQTADSLADETSIPLEDVRKHVRVLRESSELSVTTRAALDRIETAITRARDAATRCCAGTQSLLGVDRALREAEAVPALLGKRIIVVDDDQSVRDLIASILSATGCEVFPCPSGRDAQETIGRLSHDGAPPGAIISDVKLPDLNGYEVFRMARDAFPNLPVILMTGFGYDPHHSIVRASQEGLQSILFKPFKADQLVEEVTRAVGTAAPASS